jgi:hypothetical protein
VLWLGATVVIGMVIVYALIRIGRKRSGLNALGSVSERWIANERASRNDPS